MSSAVYHEFHTSNEGLVMREIQTQYGTWIVSDETPIGLCAIHPEYDGKANKSYVSANNIETLVNRVMQFGEE